MTCHTVQLSCTTKQLKEKGNREMIDLYTKELNKWQEFLNTNKLLTEEQKGQVENSIKIYKEMIQIYQEKKGNNVNYK